MYLLVSPVRSQHNLMGGSESTVCAAVFMAIPRKQKPMPLDTLKSLFGLTPSEANIVQELESGLSLSEIAAERHISQHTARDHLKAVFLKTGTRRQAELCKMVMSSPTSFISEEILLGASLAGPLDRRHIEDRRELEREAKSKKA